MSDDHAYTSIILDDGTECWCLNNKLHRDHDLPALKSPKGLSQWYREGELHRNHDLPASIWRGIRWEWYKRGKRHRDNDEPACISSNEHQEWWFEGILHRYEGPAVLYSNGSTAYLWLGHHLTAGAHQARLRAAKILKKAVLHGVPVWRWRLQRWTKRMMIINPHLKVRTLSELVIQFL